MKFIAAFFLAFFLLPLTAATGQAGDGKAAPSSLFFEDGQAAYARKDYSAARDFWQPLADEGDARAQWYIGTLYELGQGVPEDKTQAYLWFSLVAAGDSSLKPKAEVKLLHVAASMTPEQLTAAKHLARSWKPLHTASLILPVTLLMGGFAVLLLLAFNPMNDLKYRAARTRLSLWLGGFVVALLHVLHAARFTLGYLEYPLFLLFLPGSFANCILSETCSRGRQSLTQQPSAGPEAGMLAMYLINTLVIAAISYAVISAALRRKGR